MDRHTARKTLAALAAAVLAGVMLRSCVATSYLIPSDGMENTLYRGERILVNKWSYGLRLPLMAWWGYHRWAPARVPREDIVVFNNPAQASEPVVSRRAVFIGRCTGTPGDTLRVASLFAVVPEEPLAPDQKFLYSYPPARQAELDTLLARLSIHPPPLGQDSARSIRSFSRYEYYLLQQAIDGPCWISPMQDGGARRQTFPLVVPGRGTSVRVQPWNRTLLCNTLLLHEGRDARLKGDTLYVDGRPADTCTFTKDYYWVTSSNVTNVTDSRLFGFVPEDHLIGRAARIWLSKEEGTGLFSGYRWERIGARVD